MSNLLPKIQAVAPEPARILPKQTESAVTAAEAVKQSPRQIERHPSSQDLSSSEVAYVKSLMGLLPAQKMDEVLLRTGIPMPANLGLDVDTAV